MRKSILIVVLLISLIGGNTSNFLIASTNESNSTVALQSVGGFNLTPLAFATPDYDVNGQYDKLVVTIDFDVQLDMEYSFQLRFHDNTTGDWLYTNHTTVNSPTIGSALFNVELDGRRIYESNITGTVEIRIIATGTFANNTQLEFGEKAGTLALDYTEYQLPDAFFIYGSDNIVYHDQDASLNVTDCLGCVDTLIIQFDVNITVAGFYQFDFVTHFDTYSPHYIRSPLTYKKVDLPAGIYSGELPVDVRGITTNLNDSNLRYLSGGRYSGDFSNIPALYQLKQLGFNHTIDTSLFEGPVFVYKYRSFDYIYAESSSELSGLKLNYNFSIGLDVTIAFSSYIGIKVNGRTETSHTKIQTIDYVPGIYNISQEVDIRFLYNNEYEDKFEVYFIYNYTTEFESTTLATDRINPYLQPYAFNDSISIAKPDFLIDTLSLTPKYNNNSATSLGYDYAELNLSFEAKVMDDTTFSLNIEILDNGLSTVWNNYFYHNTNATTLEFSIIVPGSALYASQVVGNLTISFRNTIYHNQGGGENKTIESMIVEIDRNEWNPNGAKRNLPPPTTTTESSPTTTTAEPTTSTEDPPADDNNEGFLPLPSSLYFLSILTGIMIIRRKISN